MPFDTEPWVIRDTVSNALESNQTPDGGAAADCWASINPKNPNQVVVAARQVPLPSSFQSSALRFRVQFHCNPLDPFNGKQ